MKCEQMHELFSPYLDKMTTPQEAQSLEAHLQVCPICQKQIENMRVMCALLKNLDAPQVPASFAEDLHKHLAQEKIKIFASKELMAPKKPSWMAAGVAGIALSIGIYASSFLPFGTMMASIQSWVNKDNDKPTVAVVDNNKILQEFTDKHPGEQTTPVAEVAINTGNKAKPNPTVALNPIKLAARPLSSAGSSALAVKELVADNYVSKVKVEDMDSSMQKLIQLADANGASYNEKSSGHTLAASAASDTRVVTLQVPKDKVDEVLADLDALGAGVPYKNSSDCTQLYAELERTLTTLEQEIVNLKSQPALSAGEQAQLQQLENRQYDLLSEKQRIDRELNTVTMEVRLVEAINP